ncbi:copper resistance protein NlpE N-terminal domain-containing protein [Sphingobacteriaceae bacterium WQ 2009]|uniref:Copper resistance protein NlpE N-terminal domain-containing protein n=1 Tax=Rhinopithecimicrobium faecis TaxID=2820698 RepID=A0A8T4HF07_9SPHI|nr:copper resistance protein NlpE N-terminal domain-containing protein [Sphingobacteriaceae bacterium WQ 2009]
MPRRNIIETLSLAIAITLFAWACQSAESEQHASDEGIITLADTIAEEEKDLVITDFVGGYLGTVPCADCEGIQTKLTLAEDHTFELSAEYLGKSKEKYISKGTWISEGHKITLSDLNYHYKFRAGELWQLDVSGNDILGDEALNYKLAKQE